MIVSILHRIGFALLVLTGAGVAVSFALALVPDPSDASFLERSVANLTTFFTFDYTGPDRRVDTFPLLDVLVNRSALSFTLIGGALLVVLLVGLPTGILAALKPRNRLVNAWTSAIHLISGMPILVFGILVILIATRLFGVPPFRMFLETAGGGATFLIYLLPIVTLAVGDSLLSDVVRTLHLETTRILEQDYMRAVRARNVRAGYHVARGLLSPVIYAFAGKVAYLIGGSVVVEYVFGWQGLAYQVLSILTADGAKDYPFILAATTLFVGLTVLLNLISEIATLASDPRLRTAVSTP